MKETAGYSKSYRILSITGIVCLLMLFDMLGIYVSFYLASVFRKILIPWMGGIVYFPVYIPVVFLGILITVILFGFSRLYPGYGFSTIIEIRQLSKALTIVYGFLGISVYFFRANTDFPRTIFIFAWFLSLVIIPLQRLIIRNRASLSKLYGTPVYVVLNNLEDISVIENLQYCRRMGWKPLAVLFLNKPLIDETVSGIPQLKSLEQLLEHAKSTSIKRVVVGTQMLSLDGGAYQELFRSLNSYFSSVVLISPTYELGSIWIEPLDLEGYLGMELHYHLLDSENLIFKRVIDILGAFILLILTSPIWIIIALLIKLDSQGPVFYTHTRRGKLGKDFQLIKFRSMIFDADERLDSYLDQNPEAKLEWEEKQKIINDPRLTRVGKWLRKFSLDELPQMFNVLRGEMSLIGPRAVTEAEIEKYGSYGSLILRVKPGITGWWQVMGRNQTTWDHRTRLEVYYVSNWSLWMDGYIALKTIWVIISGQGR